MTDEEIGNDIIKCIKESQIEFLDLLISLEKIPKERLKWEKRREEISDGGKLLIFQEVYDSKTNIANPPVLIERIKKTEKNLGRNLLRKLSTLTQNGDIKWKKKDEKEFHCSICPAKNEVTLGIEKNCSENIFLRIYRVGSEKYPCGDSLFLFPLRSNILQELFKEVCNQSKRKEKWFLEGQEIMKKLGLPKNIEPVDMEDEIINKVIEKKDEIKWGPGNWRREDYIGYCNNVKIEIIKGFSAYLFRTSIKQEKFSVYVSASFSFSLDNSQKTIQRCLELEKLYSTAQKSTAKRAKENLQEL